MVCEDGCHMLDLPAELIHHILTSVDQRDLARISSVCRVLRQHAQKDLLWIPLIRDHFPEAILDTPESIQAYRHLLTELHPYGFLARRKLWFSNFSDRGRLMIVRYNPSTRTIEGHPISAQRGAGEVELWPHNTDVIIHSFNPHIQLDLDDPLIRIDAEALSERSEGLKLQQEISVRSTAHGVGSFCRAHFMLTRPWPRTAGVSSSLWPPRILPAEHRVQTESNSNFRSIGHKPSTIAEMSDCTFRLRLKIQYPTSVNYGIHEVVSTWSTLPEEAYTPTKLKPWRGIWCGDYSGHGCEFLAILQPDDPGPLPEGVLQGLARQPSSVSSNESYNTAPSFAGSDDENDQTSSSSATLQPGSSTEDTESIYSGRIEAIKLTGDANVPRGEYTFIAPDISDAGLIRIATEPIFKNARMVNSVGHIAHRGFRDDMYIPSQLILISHNRIAQYWETCGHISFYERVDIDKLMKS